jgi:RIO kinase 1
LIGEIEEIEEEEFDEQKQKVIDKVDRRLYRHEHENRFLWKRSEDYSVVDDVFDMPTLMVVKKLINDNHTKKGIIIKHPIGSGKESKVYLAEDYKHNFLVLKIYLQVNTEFKKRMQYIDGDPRFSHIKKGSRNLIATWAKKEFKNLRTAYNNGVNVPAPYEVRRNVLVMDFIGDGEGNPCSSLLNSESVTSEDYNEIIQQTSRLYQKAELVHADLSEYNIFKCGDGRIVLFDFGSSVNIKHPNSKQFLIRDIININGFFEKRGIKVLNNDLAIQDIIGRKIR